MRAKRPSCPKPPSATAAIKRPDCRQLLLALVVTEEGFPLSYEVFEGNRADVSTLEEILDWSGTQTRLPGPGLDL